MANGGVDILLNLIDKASPELRKFQDNFTRGMDETANKSEDTSNRTESAAQRMGAAFGKFGAAVATVTAVFATLGVVITAAVRQIDQLNRVSQLADKFGYTATQMQALNTVLTQMDASLTDVQGVFADVTGALIDSQDPTSEAAQAFERLGIAATDASGNLRSYEEVAVEVSNAVQKAMDDGTMSAQKMYDFQKLIGEQVLEDSAAVRAYASALELANKRAADGLGISQNAIQVAQEYRQAQNDLMAVFDTMGNQLLEIIVPTFTELAVMLYNSYTNGGLLAGVFNVLKVAATVLISVIKIVGATIIGVDAVFTGLGRSVDAFFAALDAGFNAPWGRKAEAMRGVFVDLGRDLQEIALDSASNIERMLRIDQPQGNVEMPTGPAGRGGAGGGGGGGGGRTTSAARRVQEWETMLKNLRQQRDTLGMTNLELNLYRINTIAAEMSNKRAAASFVEKASALAREIDAYEKNKEAQEQATQIQQQQGEAIRDAMVSLHDELEMIKLENSLIGASNEQREVAIRTRALEKVGIDTTTEGMRDLLAEYEKELAIKRRATEVEQIYRSTETARLEEQRRRMALITEDLAAGRITTEKYLEAVDVVLGRSSEAAETVSEFWVNAAKNMQNAMSTFFFDVMQGKMSDLVGSFKTMIDRMVAEYMASQLSSILFGDMTRSGTRATNTGLLGTIGAALSGMFRAAGGPVAGGSPYIVGEIGPELFVPKTSGTIIPANQTAAMMSGGNTIQLSVTAMDSQDVIRAMDKIKRPLAEMLNGTNRTYNLGVR